MALVTAEAQQRTISGTVSDATGQPLPGVTVRVTGTSLGTVTDATGKFALPVPSADSLLTFSYIGYTDLQLPVPLHSDALDVTMTARAGSLNEVVVVGYGAQKKVTVTGAISSVSGKELTRMPVSNVSNMLLGSTSGISGVQTSGEPGRNAASIYIRGVSTYGSQNPLVVIDGVQQPAQHPFDQLNNLSSQDIESITVLKDASATAVYGIRGANGVIVVTTKRGTVGKPQLSLSMNYGFTQAAQLLKTVNAYQYALMRNEAIRTQVAAYGDNSYTPYLFDDNDLWKF
jgi:TonB-dependent SusC/RagA subfamily outer membrane receptor